MKNLALSHIQKMQPYRPPLAERRTFQGTLLDFNERTTPPSVYVTQAFEKSPWEPSLQTYPEYGKLEQLIAAYTGLSSSQVMLTNGSDQGIEVIFRTFCAASDKVIIPAPSFDMFFQTAGVVGCDIVSPQYTSAELGYPLDEVIENIDESTKLIVICNPNNPTGGLLDLGDIEKIAQKATNSIVYIDEAYFEFSKTTAVGLIERYPNIIISRTFSKGFGLAALRIGYVLADQIYIKEMLKVRSPYPVNMAAYMSALAALENPDYMLDYSKEIMTSAKPVVENFFEENDIKFYPSSANFILFEPTDPKVVSEKLAAKGFLLRPQSKPGIEGAIRLTIGTQEQMRRFCEIYKKEILG